MEQTPTPPAFAPGKNYRIRSKGRCPERLKKRIAKLGFVCRCLRYTENSSFYPGQGPCVELMAGPHGHEDGWRAWFPVRVLDGLELPSVAAEG